ncbi:MAG: hypothetical protein WCB68_04070 [Pyrinomonadaceae bacterium]
MQSLSLPSSVEKTFAPDLAAEIARLETLLAERRGELLALQEEFRHFKSLYTQVVGSRLAELEEIERAIKQAEARTLGVEHQVESEATEDHSERRAFTSENGRKGLRKLFWSVARLFHPDHAADEAEARRRHSVMAEASRAYREGDIDSLHTLLGDEELRSYCASAHAAEEMEDLTGKLLRLKEEMRTVEFGIKRIKQDNLYRLKLSVEEDAARGKDSLAETAASINRQITKARHRLEHLA